MANFREERERSRMSAVLCCCCAGPSKEDKTRRSDADYLLPGGDWDPTLSSSPSHRTSVKSTGPLVGDDEDDNTSATSRSNTSSSRFSSNRFMSFLSKKLSWSPARRARNSQHHQSSGQYQPPPLLPSRTLPSFEDFKLLNTVGRGAFGKVMLAVHSETRILYALKVVPKAKITTQKQVEHILAESQILKRIRHPFCVALQYAFQNDDFLFYVFEFAAGGMLFYHLKKEGKFTEPRARFYFGEIILALDYLHSFGIIFRDLKPENCMLSERGHIVLTDFGSAKILQVSEKTRTIAGTPQYIAPEVLRGEPYSFSADWWSCGILLYEMLTGKTPFFAVDRVELYKLVLRGYFTVPKSVSPRARSLMYKLINKDQESRIGCSCGACQYHSAADIKQNSFFSKVPMDAEEETRYATEEAEREWENESFTSRSHRSRGSSIFNAAGSFIARSVSVSAKRMSLVSPPYLGEPCKWTWEELEARQVVPSFQPKLTSPTDLRHFDPTLTCIPPTLSDLVTTDRSLHVNDFDYVAPQEVAAVKNQQPMSSSSSAKSPPEDENELSVHVRAVESGSSKEENTNNLENSTDEEKAMRNSGAVITESVQEGQFVGFEDNEVVGKSKVVVTADVTP